MNRIIPERALGIPGPGSGPGVMGLCVPQVGSFGNGTALRNLEEVELAMFLSGFSSFQDYNHHKHVLSMLYGKLMDCPDLLHLQPQNLRLVHGVTSAVAFTVQTWEVEEQVTVTIVPAYRVLSKGKSTRLTCLPSPGGGPTAPSLLCGHVQSPACTHSTHILCWVLGD